MANSQTSAQYSIPLIYDYPNELQWTMICMYGIHSQGGAKIWFIGPMNDRNWENYNPDWYSPQDAWDAFWTALNDPNHSETAQDLIYSMDIQYQ